MEEAADPTHPSLVLSNAPARIEHAYDAAGNLVRSAIRDSGSGIERRALDYTHDVLNRLESVDDQSLELPESLTSYAYDPVGNLDAVAYGNGVTHSYAYDALNRLTDLAVNDSSSATLASYAYALGPAGNRQSVTKASGRTAAYAYDNLHRLTSETVSGAPSGVDGSVAYAYDAVGNRLSRVAVGAIASVPAMADQSEIYDDNDRLDSHTYDDNGNTIESLDPRPASLGPVADTYDFRNRLIRRVLPDGSSISLTYDADGNRVRKTILDVSAASVRSTSYLVDVNNHTGFAQVIEQRAQVDGTWHVEADYTYGHDLISQNRYQGTLPDIATASPEDYVLSFYHYDGHGTVRALADANGSITDSYEYDAFGVLLNQTGSTRNDYRYTGEQYDADLGMYFLRARYLNVRTSRFHTMDTYEGRNAEPLTLHKYVYAHANPVMNVDPSGNVTLLSKVATVFLMPTRTHSVFFARFAIGFAFGHLNILYTHSYIRTPAESLRRIQNEIRSEQIDLSIAAGVRAGTLERKIPGKALLNVSLPFISQLGGFVSAALFVNNALETRDASGVIDKYTNIIYSVCGSVRGDIDFGRLGTDVATFRFNVNPMLEDAFDIARAVRSRSKEGRERSCSSFKSRFNPYLK